MEAEMVLKITSHTRRLASIGLKGHLVYVERQRATGGLRVFTLWAGRVVIGTVATAQEAVELAVPALEGRLREMEVKRYDRKGRVGVDGGDGGVVYAVSAGGSAGAPAGVLTGGRAGGKDS